MRVPAASKNTARIWALVMVDGTLSLGDLFPLFFPCGYFD
jgi:hypothetical protein